MPDSTILSKNRVPGFADADLRFGIMLYFR